MKRLIFFTWCFLFMTVPLAAEDHYAVLQLDSSVNPIMSQYITDAISRAQKDGMKFIVIQMDTPGGFVISMQEIIQAIMASKIPVVVYTCPEGAHAASAGGYIMLSAHVAAMAPATNIGAMHPVGLADLFQSGEKKDTSGVMGIKEVNDLVAYARGLAQKRHRNVDWAERAVKNAESSTYLEAEHDNVIDFVAEDMPDLLKKLDNRKVDMDGKEIVISTNACSPVVFSMNWEQKFLEFFADPQMVMILLLIAIVGIGLEIKSPGLIAPGALGAVALFLFLLAVRILPVNIAGLALITLAVILFVLELKFISYGLLTLGGIASFVLGSMILFNSALPGGSVPMTTIIVTVLVLIAFFFIVVRAILRVHRGRVTTGREGLIEESGMALADFDAQGKGEVEVHGEIWKAQSSGPLLKGDEIVVTGVAGMMLNVRKK